MGASQSTSHVEESSENHEISDGGEDEDDQSVRKNLLFPNEILEKILSFMSTRDILVAREVCTAWLNYINAGGGMLPDRVKVKVWADELTYLAQSDPIFRRFYFHKVDLTRQSTNFWNLYSDTITHLEFYDCAVIPRNTGDSAQVEFVLGCPNLKHLGLINCDKYFLMGGTFIQLSEILHLENLESLDLSRNKNLSDNILFSILLKTKRLRSIDLSDCVNMVFMKAVHNRFYPTSTEKIVDAENAKFSDHILSFHTFCYHFLQTERAAHMKRFNFGMKLNSTGMNLIMSGNERIKWERANLESPELKSGDLRTFLEKHRPSLRGIKLGRCKLTSSELGQLNLEGLEELEMHDSRAISSLNFLFTTKNLRVLRLDGLSFNSVDFRSEMFSDLRNLKELYLNGIKFYSETTPCRQELIKTFNHLRGLTTLDLGNNPDFVDDEVVQEIIANLKKLRRLNLECSNISDLGTAGIQVQPANESDQVSESSQMVRVRGKCLSELSDLEHLDLSICRDLGERTWKAIRFRNLVSLNLTNNPALSKRGILSIIDSCRNLEKLILVHCSRQVLTDPEVLSATREKLYRCKGITY